jgi:hypothetical protein
MIQIKAAGAATALNVSQLPLSRATRRIGPASGAAPPCAFGKWQDGSKREDRRMLQALASDEVKALAAKARAVREVRDRMLTGIRDSAFAETIPARGEHNPAADLGLNVVPEDDPSRKALEDALSALPPSALRELWAIVLVGRGDYAAKDWERAVAETNRLADVGTDRFMEVADLHEYLVKAVYELEHMRRAQEGRRI